MRISKFMLFLVSVLCCFAVCACSNAPTIDGDPLLKAPRLPGDMYDIQQALDASVATPYTLKYPTQGQYKSAVTLIDITNDGHEEAVAFYSTTINDVTSISLCLLVYQNEEWVAVSDSHAYASSVEQVVFDDLDGDGNLEIIVGWVTGPTDKQLAVYSYADGTLSQRLQEKYTVFLSCNLNSAEHNSLLVVNLDASQSTSRATLYNLEGKEVTTWGSCSLDGGVTSYSQPLLASLPDGRPAIYLDGVKGAGTLTEVLYFDNGTLVNGAYDLLAGSTSSTFRASNVAVTDINGDDVPDIPMQLDFLGMSGIAESDKSYVTVWCNHTTKGLTKKLTAYMNYTDYYSFELPSGWQEGVTLEKDSKKRSRNFYAWNKKKNEKSALLLQLVTVTKESLVNVKAYTEDGFELIAENDGLVYLARCPKTESKLKIDIEQVKKLFKTLDIGVK